MIVEVFAEPLSIQEIEALFPNHWILIDRPEFDSSREIVKGIPVFADADKTNVYPKIGELKLGRCALHCTLKELPDEKYA